MSNEPIAAIATGVEGSISIIRVSGDGCAELLERLWQGRKRLTALPVRCLRFGRLCDGQRTEIDQCLAVFFPAPHSYTGEDVVEFQVHGGPQVARLCLEAVLLAGARHAEPGEFTKRAFINARLDLTQAEAVADVIQAHSEMALHAANRQLQGRLGRRIDAICQQLSELLAELEVRMDFVDEDLDWLSPEQLQTLVDAGLCEITDLLASARTGDVLRHGIRLVIAGAPNAGKSSLLNLILGQDRAIVTELPGTTRDTLEELAHIRGIPVRLIDTAGLRQAVDLVEQYGVERSHASIAGAQIILWVLDASRPIQGQELPETAARDKIIIAIANKSDLAPGQCFAQELPQPALPLCTLNGDGLDGVLDAIERMVWGHPHHQEPEVAVNARHQSLLTEAEQHLKTVAERLPLQQFEILAVSLRGALDALGQINGSAVQPDILEHIFSRFCIGK